MRVVCPHCGSVAKITHTKKLHRADREHRVTCQADSCSAKFVMILSHSHDVQLPVSEHLTMVEEVLANMDEGERRELFDKHSGKVRTEIYR